ncbi:Outer membrane assembly lipoprotein yfgL [Rickettsiales bacterium Ac37b]|nr:Outer membrane assembly lipoprotein yfgL [Rickettsiales bacterium Ac37b]
MFIVKLLIAFLLLITNNCSTLSNLIAEKDSSPALTGERITILKLENDLVANKQMEDINIKLPLQQENFAWSNSNGSEYDYPENIKLPQIKSCLSYSLGLSRKTYINSTPVIADDLILIMAKKASVVAFKNNNLSKPLWTKNTMPIDEKEDYIGGGMVYAHDKLFVTAGHRDVLALNIHNGKEIWRHSLNNIIRAAPILSQNTLFVVTIDNKLYAIDSTSGNVIWMHEGASESIGIFGAASIAASNNVVVIPHSSGQLHGLNINTGEELWSVNLAFNKSSLMGFSFSDIDITPVIRDNIVYVAGNTGSLYAIHLENGMPLWHKNIKGIKSLWVAGEFLYIINDENEILAIYNKNGHIKWVNKLQLADTNKSSSKIKSFGPILAGDLLLFTTDIGKLLFVSPYEGKIIREMSISKNVHSLPIVASSKLFIMSDNGTLSICE